MFITDAYNDAENKLVGISILKEILSIIKNLQSQNSML